MANIITSKTRAWYQTKPVAGSTLAMGHPLSKDLVGVWLMNEGGGNFTRDLARGNNGQFLVANADPPGPYFQNNYVYFSSSGDPYIYCGNPAILHPNRNFSIVCGFNFETGAVGLVSHGQGEWYFRISSGKLNFLESNTADFFSGATTISAGVNYQGAVTVGPASTAALKIYLNGRLDGSGSTSNTINNGNQGFHIGCDIQTGGNKGEFFIGKYYYLYFYNKVLSPSEISSLKVAPFQMIAPMRRVRYIIPVAGGDVPVNATVTPSAIPASFFVPAVTVTATALSVSASVSVSPVFSSFTVNAASVVTTTNALISATAVSSRFEVVPASVSVGGNASVTVSAVQAKFAVNAASVSTASGTIAPAQAVMASFAVNAVTVTAIKNANITVSAIALRLAVNPVSISTAAGISVTVAALESKFVINSVTVTVTTNAEVLVSFVQTSFITGVPVVSVTRNAVISAGSAMAQWVVGASTVTIAYGASQIADTILLQSLISKDIILNSRAEKTLLLNSPLH